MTRVPVASRLPAASARTASGTLLRVVWCLVGWLCLASQACALKVTFVNPGKSDETFWVTASQAMQVAADSLHLELEVLYAQRDHLRLVELVRQVAQRAPGQRPDYLVLVNERRMGGDMLKIASGAGIKCLFAFNTLMEEDRALYGRPRAQYPLWLGSVVPHAEDAGYLTAHALIERGLRERRFGADGKLHMVAIAGDRSTESSILRNRGMERAAQENPRVVLDQTVYADWRRDTAKAMAQELFVRYPEATLVWAGSDLMAFGAMDALVAKGERPGIDRWLSGINTSRDAMQELIAGRMESLAGGHFMAGAWALVMIYDHAHGHDFADEGLELDKPMFARFDAELARRFVDRFGPGVPAIDFRNFSKAANPKRKRYDFGFATLL